MDLDAGINRQIQYSIDFGNQQNYFSMNKSTGDIRLTELISLESFETKEFLLFVTATDGRSVERLAAMCISMPPILDHLKKMLIFPSQEVF